MKGLVLEAVGLGAGGHVVAAGARRARRGWRSGAGGGDGSTAAQCQSGHSCGGAPVAAMCQSGYRAVGDRSRSGRCRVRMPCVRVGPPAAVESAGMIWVGG